MWIYLCSICAREQSVGGAWVAFPARSSNPEFVCLFGCFLFACLLDYLKIYTFDMLNLFGSFSRNTCEYNLRCCWDSHSWSQTSHRPHPALWDSKLINQGIIFQIHQSKVLFCWKCEVLAANGKATLQQHQWRPEWQFSQSWTHSTPTLWENLHFWQFTIMVA